MLVCKKPNENGHFFEANQSKIALLSARMPQVL
jgi:hypothetical protein